MVTLVPPFFVALEHWYLANATLLGRRTAELHEALADASEPAFAPEPLWGETLVAVVRDMRRHAVDALELLRAKRDALPDTARAAADEVLDARDRILARIDAASDVRAAGQHIRVHGDYHLGQVLRVEEDFVIVDFEGEPGRTRAERRAKYSPVKDVASMVRSFGYAAHAALLAFTLHAPGNADALFDWAVTWEHWVRQAFLTGYRTALDDSPLIPHGSDWQTLLDAFVVDKALYELTYEMNNRPEWIRIPLVGLASALQS